MLDIELTLYERLQSRGRILIGFGSAIASVVLVAIVGQTIGLTKPSEHFQFIHDGFFVSIIVLITLCYISVLVSAILVGFALTHFIRHGEEDSGISLTATNFGQVINRWWITQPNIDTVEESYLIEAAAADDLVREGLEIAFLDCKEQQAPSFSRKDIPKKLIDNAIFRKPRISKEKLLKESLVLRDQLTRQFEACPTCYHEAHDWFRILVSYRDPNAADTQVEPDPDMYQYIRQRDPEDLASLVVSINLLAVTSVFYLNENGDVGFSKMSGKHEAKYRMAIAALFEQDHRTVKELPIVNALVHLSSTRGKGDRIHSFRRAFWYILSLLCSHILPGRCRRPEAPEMPPHVDMRSSSLAASMHKSETGLTHLSRLWGNSSKSSYDVDATKNYPSDDIVNVDNQPAIHSIWHTTTSQAKNLDDDSCDRFEDSPVDRHPLTANATDTNLVRKRQHWRRALNADLFSISPGYPLQLAESVLANYLGRADRKFPDTHPAKSGQWWWKLNDYRLHRLGLTEQSARTFASTYFAAQQLRSTNWNLWWRLRTAEKFLVLAVPWVLTAITLLGIAVLVSGLAYQYGSTRTNASKGNTFVQSAQPMRADESSVSVEQHNDRTPTILRDQ